MKIWMLIGIQIYFILQINAQSNVSVIYSKQVIDSATVHTIYANLADKHVKLTPLVPIKKRGAVALFSEFQSFYNPIAYVTGSLFTVKTGLPIGDVIINAAQVIYNKEPVGSALTITKAGNVAIIDDRPLQKNPWCGYESVLQGGVRLVKSGVVTCDPLKQGFHDEFMLRPTYRIAIGITNVKKIVLVTVQTSVTLNKLAEIMQKLKCKDAMALDGGASAGCAYQRRIILPTRRRISNVLALITI